MTIGLDGSIEEIGYFIPMGTRSSGVYFRNDRVAYVADYYRGFDVIKFTGDIPPNAPDPRTPPVGQVHGDPGTPPKPLTGGESSSPRSRSFSDLVALPRKCGKRARFRIKLRKTDDPVISVKVKVGKGKAKTFKGKALRKPLRVKKLPKRKKFNLQVQVRTRSGHQTAGQRSYRGCR